MTWEPTGAETALLSHVPVTYPAFEGLSRSCRYIGPSECPGAPRKYRPASRRYITCGNQNCPLASQGCRPIGRKDLFIVCPLTSDGTTPCRGAVWEVGSAPGVGWCSRLHLFRYATAVGRAWWTTTPAYTRQPVISFGGPLPFWRL